MNVKSIIKTKPEWQCLIGVAKKLKVKFELVAMLFPFSWLSNFQKCKAHFWDTLGSAVPGG